MDHFYFGAMVLDTLFAKPTKNSIEISRCYYDVAIMFIQRVFVRWWDRNVKGQVVIALVIDIRDILKLSEIQK